MGWRGVVCNCNKKNIFNCVYSSRYMFKFFDKGVLDSCSEIPMYSVLVHTSWQVGIVTSREDCKLLRLLVEIHAIVSQQTSQNHF